MNRPAPETAPETTPGATPAAQPGGTAAPESMRVMDLRPADFARWDEFVPGCGEAFFLHRTGWRRLS